ncbi:hypothetical protein BGZ82_003127 [Podila clonocystis]|nr:hypothetical protein BGZ82_003127 [Podila clonocystis]
MAIIDSHPKTKTSSYPMRIQWEPPPVATSAAFYDALALPYLEQGDDSLTSNSPDARKIPAGRTTDDTTDMSSTTTTPQDTPQHTSSSERSLGNLGPVLSFLDLEKKGLRSERPTILINPNVASGSLGDFSQAFRYLKTQRHQVEAHRSPSEQRISSSSLSLLSSLLGTHVMEESDKSITFIINRDNQESREVPSPEKEKRKLKKKSSRRILAIDEPSSSSGGGCASSESDQKETFVEKKTSMENVDVYFIEETKVTDPKNTHAVENKPRTRRQAPTPPKKWHWTLRGTMTEMERLFRTERLAQEERRLKITTTTVKTRRSSDILDSGTEDDDRRANSRSGNSTITRKPPSKIFWSKNSEYLQKTHVVQTKPLDALYAPTTSVQRTSEEPLSPLSHLVAMRKRDMFPVPKGLDRLTKVLPRSPSVTCSSSTDTSEEESSPTTTATETATTTLTTALTTTPTVSSSAQPDKHSPSPNPLTLGSIWPIADKNNPLALSVPGPERVFVFVDNSNILTGFYHYYERMVPPQSPTLHHHHLDKRDQDDDNTKDTFLEVSPSSPPRDEHSTDSEEEIVLYPRSTRSCTDAKRASPTTPSTDFPTTTSTDMPPVKARPIMVKNRSFRPKFDYASFFSLLQRSRPTERRILVGSAPLFQELDVAMEYQYETKILRRVRKFVQGELGTVPVPIKQPRYMPSDALILFNNNTDPSSGQGSHPSDKDARPSSLVPLGPGSGSGATQGEQCVDELLHLKMLETILDHEPAVMVLATGDGGDSEFGGEGFYGVIKRALGRGWQVEIVSWEDQLSGVYIELAQEYKYPPEIEHAGAYRPSHQQRGRHLSHPPRPALGRKGSLRIICLDWVGKQFTQP